MVLPMPEACPTCQLKHQCVCDALPSCQSSAHIALLMHENELSRETNTGRWLLASVTPSSRHIWQRTAPCTELNRLINDSRYRPYVLFPNDESIAVEKIKSDISQQETTPLFIILDGTWQEAKKMLRKSAWLRELPTAHITPQHASNYQLRRNQEQGHLCTLEVGCELVSALGNERGAKELSQFFNHFMQVFKADKSGHAYRS